MFARIRRWWKYRHINLSAETKLGLMCRLGILELTRFLGDMQNVIISDLKNLKIVKDSPIGLGIVEAECFFKIYKSMPPIYVLKLGKGVVRREFSMYFGNKNIYFTYYLYENSEPSQMYKTNAVIYLEQDSQSRLVSYCASYAPTSFEERKTRLYWYDTHFASEDRIRQSLEFLQGMCFTLAEKVKLAVDELIPD